MPDFGALMGAPSVESAELLLREGADVAAVGELWSNGHGVVHVVPEVGKFLVARSAPLTVHVAAGLGLTDRLAEMLTANPELVKAKGVDSCTPFALCAKRRNGCAFA